MTGLGSRKMTAVGCERAPRTSCSRLSLDRDVCS